MFKSKYLLYSFLSLFLINFTNSEINANQNNTSNLNNEVIIKIGNEKITYGDIQRAFQKNMNRKNDLLLNVSKDSINRFIDLFTNYKLKVLDAKDKGLENDESVIKEFQSQRKLLAESFLFEKKVLEPNVELALKRRDREVMMSIILVSFEQGVMTVNKEPYRKKAQEALDKILAGANFADICREYTTDEEIKKTNGFIKNYITSCDKIQRPIENALYEIKVGEVYPKIIETNFGYLIVKKERDEARKYVKARHILIQKKNEEDTENINRKADSLIALIKKGKSFERLAEENSDDAQSAIYGGYIGNYYNRSTGVIGNGSRLVDEFVDALYNLKDGEVSGKVNSDFGIHIIRRDSTLDINLENEKADIIKNYKRLYYDEDKSLYLDKLMKDHNFVIDELNLQKLIAKCDTTKTNLDPAFVKLKDSVIKDYIIVSNKDKKWTIDNLIDFSLKNENKLRGVATNHSGFTKSIKKMIESDLIAISTKDMEKEYEEFAKLSQDFYEGILLFRVENENVWEKLKLDTVIAQKYYDSTYTRYKTDLFYDISEIFILNDSLAKEVYAKAKNGENFDQLAANYTQRPGYREKEGKWGQMSARRSKFANLLQTRKFNVGDLLEPTQFETGYIILRINEVIPPRQKTLDEALNDMSADIQNIVRQNLLNSWLQGVKSKHKVEVDWAKLEQLTAKVQSNSKSNKENKLETKSTKKNKK